MVARTRAGLGLKRPRTPCVDAQKLVILRRRRCLGRVVGMQPIRIDRAVSPHRAPYDRELAGHRHHRLLVASAWRSFGPSFSAPSCLCSASAWRSRPRRARAGRPDRRPLRGRASTPLQLPPVTTEHCNKTASWSSTTHSAVSSIGTTSPATCAIAVTLRRVGGRESAPATDNVPVGDCFRARLRGNGSASCPDYIRSSMARVHVQQLRHSDTRNSHPKLSGPRSLIATAPRATAPE